MGGATQPVLYATIDHILYVQKYIKGKFTILATVAASCCEEAPPAGVGHGRNGTLPSLFIAFNLLRPWRLDGDAAPSDTLSITQAIKAEVMERRK